MPKANFLPYGIAPGQAIRTQHGHSMDAIIFDNEKHSIPHAGRAHVLSECCVCNPQKEGDIFIHNRLEEIELPKPKPTPEPQPTSAHAILTKAAQIVSGDRAAQHGPKERNHQNIADHWNAYLTNRLKTPLTPHDVALMMVELKIARAKGVIQMGLETNLDNYVDMAGYAGVAGEIAMNKGKEA